MENNPLVSVIMNCYNSDNYLKEAIESVLSQTYENFEIIFWDNQSTDSSANIVQSFSDNRIKYFYAPNHTSLGEGRNLALEKVTGKYISFLDCDDLYPEEKIEETLKCFDDEVALVYTNGYTLYNEENIKKQFYKVNQISGDVFEAWIASYQVMIPSVMFKKEVLNNLEYWFDNRFNMIEEFDFFIRIAKKYKVAYLDKNLCIWRAHSGSLTWSKRELFSKENKIFLDNMLNKYPNMNDTNCIMHFKAKIAYQQFYNGWKSSGVADRTYLQPYLLVEKRLIIVYLLSLFGFRVFKFILKSMGKAL